MGLLRVEEQVMKRLRRIPNYFLKMIKVDSKKFGAPVSRPRLYFLLIRRDVLMTGMTDEAVHSYAEEVLACMQCDSRQPFTELLFPPGHTLVKEAAARP